MDQLEQLRAANVARQAEWCPDQLPDLSFRGNELGGECGEAQNVIKKLERERHGWAGSRATVDQLAQELADVILCVDLVAQQAGIDLWSAIVAKFNATSEARGLRTLLAASPAPADPRREQVEAVAVKALRWKRRRRGSDDFYVETDVGEYCAGLVHSSYVAIRRSIRDAQLHDEVLSRGLGLEEAREAAQADYEARIRSALVPAPATAPAPAAEACPAVIVAMGKQLDVLRCRADLSDADLAALYRAGVSAALAAPASAKVEAAL